MIIVLYLIALKTNYKSLFSHEKILQKNQLVESFFFVRSIVKFGKEESCNSEHSLRFHGGGRDNLYPMISMSGDGLSSLVQVSLPLLLGMLEDSAMKLAKSQVISRVEGYGIPASTTKANSPDCCRRPCRSLRNFRIPAESLQ